MPLFYKIPHKQMKTYAATLYKAGISHYAVLSL